MIETNAEPKRAAKGEAGIALVLAIMALMLLTFLGLTLAATTSTELQIATNYRWSQQALYNAEAGMEAGKIILRNIPGAISWNTILPTIRAVPWETDDPIPAPATLVPLAPAGALGNDQWGNAPRNFESGGCDQRGAGMGYGVILNDVGSLAPQGLMQNRTVMFGQRLNGAVTLWVRRDTGIAMNGQILDATPDSALVLTAEGVAPYTDGASTLAFAQANQAVRVVETYLLRSLGGASSSPCEAYRAQVGGGVSGSNFAVCNDIVLTCPPPGGTPQGGGAEDALLRSALGDITRDAGGTLSHGSGFTGTLGSLSGTSPDGCVE